jgi:hypothetical protein
VDVSLGEWKALHPCSTFNVGALEDHAKNDPYDIIPPFVMEEGTTFPGQNMETIYGDGYTGAEVIANDCDVPAGGEEVTITETTEVSATVPVTDPIPPPR